VRRGKTFASLPHEGALFEVNLDEALRLLSEKTAGKPVLKELGAHPESGATVQIIDGRYGPYVTDGQVNASLPKGTEADDVDMEEAVDLLRKAAKRKGKGGGRRPATRGGGRGGRGGSGRGQGRKTS
jgi:DNA topoisomerase-1